MRLSNEIVQNGDKVFCLINGIGFILDVRENGALIRFGTRQIFYDDGGVNKLYSKRTLFWHEPVYFEPPKDIRERNKQNDFIEAVNVFFNEVKNGKSKD
jgi:hypothetical protein